MGIAPEDHSFFGASSVKGSPRSEGGDAAAFSGACRSTWSADVIARRLVPMTEQRRPTRQALRLSCRRLISVQHPGARWQVQ